MNANRTEGCPARRKVREIAFSKCGDTGDTSNICVFPYDDADFEWLKTWLTAEVVKEKFGSLVKGKITRYDFPNIHGFNFVLEQAYAGGRTLSLRIDQMGKSFQSLVLDIDMPERTAV